MQLLLIDYRPSNAEISEHVHILEKKTDSMRKGLFARHSELSKMYHQMKDEIEQLKVALNNMK